MAARTSPPFRADQVGSLLRTTPIADARAKRAANRISPGELRSIEDAEIEKLIRGGQIDLQTGLAYATNVGNLKLKLSDLRLQAACGSQA